MALPEKAQRFRRIATAGIFFQGGGSAADTSTIIAALVERLTGSPTAVGAAAAISRYGWLFPQVFVAYFAQRRRRRLPFYMLGAFGRVGCLFAVATIVAIAGPTPGHVELGAFFAFWALYAFVSGIVAVPYNDIVARAVVSDERSRLLAIRFFGGGLLALGVAGAARWLLGMAPFPVGYAAVLALGAVLLLVSTLSFVSAGEPLAPQPPRENGLVRFLRRGLAVYRGDGRFRLFVYARWLESAAGMALPFYIVQATRSGIGSAEVALLLGAQTAGALTSNPLWGWFGDRVGKRALLELVAAFGILAPVLAVVWLAADWSGAALLWFGAIFFVLGGVGNGATIAQLGYLMEISPDDQRPAYSGYFNAIVAPASLSPLLGAALVEHIALPAVFVASGIAAALQIGVIRLLRNRELEEAG